MFQNFNFSLSFNAMHSRKKVKKLNESYPFKKNKRIKPYINNLRHSSLHMDVFNLRINIHHWEFVIEQNIHVKKIKVQKLVLNLPKFL